MTTGARARNRAATEARIMAIARRQLAEVGADALSLRSISREVGLVSSAVYRYVPSRDALLTRLIIGAYDSLGETVERAIAETDGDLARWLAGAAAIRSWARDRPHEYLLLYGTPVPGYAAPTDTVQPGTRVLRALVAITDEAATADRLAPPTDGTESIAPNLRRDLERLVEIAEVSIRPESAMATLLGWTQMFGLIGFELTNQTRGVVDDHEALFLACASQTGRGIGLR